MRHVLRGRSLVLGGAAGVFLAASALPVLYMIVTSFGGARPGAVLLDARQLRLLWNSALLAGSAAVLATLVGVPLGFALGRIPSRRTSLLRAALAAPVLFPPYVVALAWTYVGGSSGVAAALAGPGVVSAWTYSLPAAAAVLALVYYPVVMLATEAALRQIDPQLEEAGLTAAPPWHVLSRVTLPLAAPAMAGASLVVFVLAISDFGVPGLLRVRVYTTEVFTAFAALYDFSRATALTLPLLLLAAAPAAAAAVLLRTRVIAGAARGRPAQGLELAGWRGPMRLLTAATVAIALAGPVAVLLREAAGTSIAAAAAGSLPSIRTSLLVATVSATLVVLVGGWVGYARARASSRAGHLADVLCVVLFAVPSTVVGVGLIGLWNRPGAPGLLYGTSAMLVLACLARLLPVAALVVAASVRQVPVSHEEAAAAAGVGWLRAVAAIVVPQTARGLAAAWLVAFVFAFGELGASILVSPPGESTLPIRIYTIIANTPASVVAALALLQVTVIFVPLALAAVYLARRPAQ